MKIIKDQVLLIVCSTYQWCLRPREAQREIQRLTLAQKHCKLFFKSNLNPLRKHKSMSCRLIWKNTTINLKIVKKITNFQQNKGTQNKVSQISFSKKTRSRMSLMIFKPLHQLKTTMKMENSMNSETYSFKEELSMLNKSMLWTKIFLSSVFAKINLLRLKLEIILYKISIFLILIKLRIYMAASKNSKNKLITLKFTDLILLVLNLTNSTWDMEI
jgi:hypothetical protein